MLRPAHALAVLLAAVGVVGGGCGASDGGSDAACAYVVEVAGERWYGVSALRRPPLGDRAGNGRVPECDDGFGPSGGHTVALAVVPGLDPEQVLGIVGEDDVVLVRQPGALPPALEELISPPCRAADGVVTLAGMWVAVLGPDGQSTRVLAPPYDVRVVVTASSVPYYEGGNVVVRVPVALGRPLDEADVDGVLFRAGDLHLTVHCDGARYVADRVRAVPRAG